MAGLRFLGTLGPGLIGADRKTGVLVMNDLGRATGLDPCPDNVLMLPTGLRIIDFERGMFGPATVDGSFLRMAMPTCWCVGLVPADVLTDVEARYRAAASRGIPALRDDGRYSAGMAAGCATHLVVTLGWHLQDALGQDRTWGRGTLRERILTRLALFAPVEGWPGLHEAGAVLARILRERWGEVGLRPYPAFP